MGEVALWLFFRGMLVGTEGRGKSRKIEVVRMKIPTRRKFRRPRTSILRIVARRLRAYGEKSEMGPGPKNPEKKTAIYLCKLLIYRLGRLILM